LPVFYPQNVFEASLILEAKKYSSFILCTVVFIPREDRLKKLSLEHNKWPGALKKNSSTMLKLL
jgi:hypothetical protein